MPMLELLAPAGSMDALKAAVQNGADAVYLGCGTFNARQSAKNFTPQTLAEAVKYCHVRGVQVHLTLNTLVSDRETPELILEKVASMSCKAAVKGNQSLSFSEFDALVTELLTLDNPYHCPHGRPTIISMTKYEIEKKFKRII